MDAREPKAPTLHVEPVWKDGSVEVRRELVDLWTRTRALRDPFTAAARSNQAVCVARDAAGDIVAVATAVVKVLPRLQEPLYFYRQFFVPEVRGQGHAVGFFNGARRILAAYNASLPQPESLGLLLELENQTMARHYDRAVVAEAGSVFIGYSPRGLQLRVTYFEGAKLQGRPYVRPRAAAS